MGRPPSTRTGASVLGWLGVAPFFLASALTWAGSGRVGAAAHYASIALLAYGGTIAAFLGGARWGREISRAEGPHAVGLVAAVSAQLAACACLAAPMATELRFAGLLVVVALAGAADLSAVELPIWYRRLRLPLTVGACAALASGFVWALRLHRAAESIAS